MASYICYIGLKAKRAQEVELMINEQKVSVTWEKVLLMHMSTLLSQVLDTPLCDPLQYSELSLF